MQFASKSMKITIKESYVYKNYLETLKKHVIESLRLNMIRQKR